MSKQMQRVVHSEPGALVEALAREIGAWRNDKGALAPVSIMVPHRAMKAWLLSELSAVGGGVVNLHFTWPREWVERLGPPRAPLSAIYRALSAPQRLRTAAFKEARNYIEREEAPARQQVRRHELARRLQEAFDGCSAHWPGGLETSGSWQAEVWRAVAEEVPPDESAGEPLPLFVFDVPLPGWDLLAALERHAAPVTVFMRSVPAEAGNDAWSRHGALRREGLSRWEARTRLLSSGAGGPATLALPEVELLGANSLRRLCEAAVATAWGWVRDETATPRVRFHEIGMVIPSARRDDLLPVLREVLREAHHLPTVLWNQPLRGGNPVASLAQSLLELPGGPLRRAEVLAILRHPVMGAAFEDQLPEEWTGWLDSVGVFHGLDAEALENTYLKGLTAVHWDQGLTRLALGAFLGGDRSGSATFFEAPQGPLLVEERTQSAQPGLGALLRLVRSLLADATQMASAALSVSQWRRLFTDYLSTYIRPNDNAGRKTLNALLRALEQVEASGLEGAISFPLAQRMALEALDAVPGDAGTHLFEAVRVGTPGDFDGVPLRRLVFLGLEEGSFPVRSRRSELDPRPEEAQRWDDPRRRDAGSFWTLLHGTQDKACLLYLSHDPITGEPKQPSLLVLDLAEQLKARGRPLKPQVLEPVRYLPAYAAPPPSGAEPRPKPPHDLRDERFTWAFPEAALEREVAELGAAAFKSLGRPIAANEVPDGWRALLQTRPPAPVPASQDGVMEVSLEDLVLSLQCPAQGYARRILHLRNQEEENATAMDEPLAMWGIPRASIYKNVLFQLALSHPKTAVEAEKRMPQLFDSEVRLRSARGQLPVGFFGQLQRTESLDELGDLWNQVVEVVPEEALRGARLMRWGASRAGTTPGAAPASAVERVISVRGSLRTVRVTGESGVLFQDGAVQFVYKSSLLLQAPPDWAWAVAMRAGTRAWVSHLLLLLSEGDQERTTVLLGRDGCLRWDWPSLTKDEAGKALDLALGRLLNERVGYKAPAVALFKAWERLAPEATTPEQRQDALRETCEAAYGGLESTEYSVLREIPLLPLPTDVQLQGLYRCLEPFVLADAQRRPSVPDKAPAAAMKKGGKKG